MKSVVAFILTLIGGIGQLLSALMLFTGGTYLAFMFPGFLTTIGIVMPIIYLAAGGTAIWASLMMRKDDNAKVKNGGIIALVAGIVGFNLLVIVGGIIALVQANK